MNRFFVVFFFLDYILSIKKWRGLGIEMLFLLLLMLFIVIWVWVWVWERVSEKFVLVFDNGWDE